jgi:hypothetical protein
VEIFAVNRAGNLYEQTEAAGGGYGRSSWYLIGDDITTIAAGRGANGRAEIFAVNTAGNLFEQTEAAGGGYSSNGWQYIDSSI